MTATNGKTSGTLLGLHAQTGLHPGAGTALGTVDLPVQRERHTHWPTIAGSAVKGVLRDAVREQVLPEYQDDGPEKPEKERRGRRRKANEDNGDLVTLFGPGKVDESSAHAGAVSITDARLAAFPVRSLKGIFAWVTCPAALDRLQRDAVLAGMAVSWTPPQVSARHCQLPAADCPCLVEGTNQVILEEFDFARTEQPNGTIADWMAQHLLPNRPEYEGTRKRLAKTLLVLHDDDFTHFARYATEVVARIGLDYDTKTVRKGALFYQEFLPTETLLYCVVLASAARSRNGQGLDAPGILGRLRSYLDKTPVLQLGGDETIGKGLCGVRLL